MIIQISANGKPQRPVVFCLLQFAVSLIALPAYYLAGRFLQTDTAIALAAIGVLILTFSWVRRLMQPQSLLVRYESSDRTRFSGVFESDAVPYTESMPLLGANLETDCLVLQSGASERRFELTTQCFGLATLVALEAAIAELESGLAPNVGVLPDSVRVSKHEHKGNSFLRLTERPTAIYLQLLALGMGLSVFFFYILLAARAAS